MAHWQTLPVHEAYKVNKLQGEMKYYLFIGMEAAAYEVVRIGLKLRHSKGKSFYIKLWVTILCTLEQ